jgi:uncharacterized protein YdcH (DUF465 family)
LTRPRRSGRSGPWIVEIRAHIIGDRLEASSDSAPELKRRERIVMMRVPHELSDDFSQEIDLIERMKETDHRFARLATNYEDVNREIFSIESEEHPTTDEVLETLKKRRLLLKDEIAEVLRNLHRRM